MPDEAIDVLDAAGHWQAILRQPDPSRPQIGLDALVRDRVESETFQKRFKRFGAPRAFVHTRKQALIKGHNARPCHPRQSGTGR